MPEPVKEIKPTAVYTPKAYTGRPELIISLEGASDEEARGLFGYMAVAVQQLTEEYPNFRLAKEERYGIAAAIRHALQDAPKGPPR